MPSYQKTPFKPTPNLLTSGRPSYLWGSLNDRTSAPQGFVISDSSVTTTATVTFQLMAGYALNTATLNGEQITIVGTSNSSGVFNVINATIVTAVTNSLTGVCTVTFTIASTSQATLSDFGQVLVSVPEVSETVAASAFTSNAVASVPVAVPFNNPDPSQGRVLTAVINISGTFNAQTATVQIQEALQDIDSEYQTILPAVGGTGGPPPTSLAALSAAGSGVATYTFLSGRFYRFLITVGASAGVSLSVIAKING